MRIGKKCVSVMDYKEIIKSRKTRIKIMQMLSFVPDKVMLKIQYRIKLGRKLDLKNPQRYTEKLQWYKLNYRNPLMKICADKYDVRQYVDNRGLKNTLNELYGIYSTPDEIDFENLPSSFVIKDTLGGGGNSVIIVKNKNEMNERLVRKQMEEWVNEPIKMKHPGREWVYEGKKHRIIIEKNLITENNNDLPDYKFFCFNGKVECLYLMQNYTMHHSEGEMGFFDNNFNMLDARRMDFKPILNPPQKPHNFVKMVEYASILSEGFPHVRVDFYNLNGQIVFGEMTFFNASGYTEFEPDEFDYTLGEKFVL